jgi:hypothetical protein
MTRRPPAVFALVLKYGDRGDGSACWPSLMNSADAMRRGRPSTVRAENYGFR